MTPPRWLLLLAALGPALLPGSSEPARCACVASLNGQPRDRVDVEGPIGEAVTTCLAIRPGLDCACECEGG